VDLGIEALFFENRLPEIIGFLVEVGGFAGPGAINGGIEPFLG
jgi:hypothetical protein